MAAAVKELKSANELAALLREEARKTGKCDNLGSIFVYPAQRRDENWDFGTGGSVPAEQISDACRIELGLIAGRLKLKYDLK
jgi:hypothetical protein